MVSGIYPFKIGEFQCTVISDGSLAVPTPDMMDKRPFNPFDPDSGKSTDITWMFTEVNCLFIQKGKRKILVETGCGNGMQSTAGKLLENLNLIGIQSPDIDTVLFTHAHADHIGGNVDEKGNLIFANARYMMHRKEWEHWFPQIQDKNIEEKTSLGVARQNLLPIRNRVALFDDNAELMQGIRSIATPGHTPGSVVYMVSSGKDRLYVTGDLMHLETDVGKAAKILPGLAEPGAIVFAGHFKFPGLGHFTKKRNKLFWQPITPAG
jgi:glyoxylase-like metal-dependent hydrolase (beta-lactamase superfamily II)